MHSKTLEQLLVDKIAVSGSIPFSEFMENCLYHPQFGYYSSGRKVVGRDGDFYTSVSTGELFGRLLADGFYQVWEQLGKPERWQIVEQGANRGDLASDVLARLRELDEQAWQAVEYVMVEPFPALRKLQRETLTAKGLADQLRQVSSLAELPEKSVRGVFFSNELPDAFPVRCVKFFDGEWHEMRVVRDANRQVFDWREVPCDEELLALIAEFDIPALEGYCAEVSPLTARWMGEVASRLAAGLMVTVDYGGLREELYTAERNAGTLRAYRRHHQESDVLASPGEQDLTAHVNFSQLITNGERHGLRMREYTDQHHYLVGLGQLRFFREMEQAANDEPALMTRLLRQYKTLMHPVMMGVQFKVLVLETDWD
ncbi:MAG: SAM-dependent methyltransferase [Verrucomicrobiales bacterium]|nr:SAM-dependent methyltransferase [Verrucomicrobiales bacterium]